MTSCTTRLPQHDPLIKIPVSSHSMRASQYTLCGDFHSTSTMKLCSTLQVVADHYHRAPSIYFTKLKRPSSLSLSTEAPNPWQVSCGPSLLPSHCFRTEIPTARCTCPEVATPVVSQGGCSLPCLRCHAPPNAAQFAFGLINFEHVLLVLLAFLFMGRLFSSGSLLSCSGPSLPSFVGLFCP